MILDEDDKFVLLQTMLCIRRFLTTFNAWTICMILWFGLRWKLNRIESKCFKLKPNRTVVIVTVEKIYKKKQTKSNFRSFKIVSKCFKPNQTIL